MDSFLAVQAPMDGKEVEEKFHSATLAKIECKDCEFGSISGIYIITGSKVTRGRGGDFVGNGTVIVRTRESGGDTPTSVASHHALRQKRTSAGYDCYLSATLGYYVRDYYFNPRTE